MSNLAIRIKAEALRSVSAATIAGSPGVYMGIGTAYQHPVRIYYLQNLTDATLLFSWDGVTDNIILIANAFILIDVASNQSRVGGIFSISQGDRTYVKTSGVPTTGAVYLSIFYGSNG